MPASKHEHVPAERILFQLHLNLGAEPVETSAQVGDPGGDPDLGAGWDRDNASSSSNTTRNECGSPSSQIALQPKVRQMSRGHANRGNGVLNSGCCC